MPVGFIEDGSGEDADVEEDAETVVDKKAGDQPQEEGFEVEGGRVENLEGHHVPWKKGEQ